MTPARPALTVPILALALSAAGCVPETDPDSASASGRAAARPVKSASAPRAVRPPPAPPRPRPADGPESLVGEPVPPFEMTDLAGRRLSDLSLRGRVVLIDFWATWCGPCRLASPVMQRLHDRYAAYGLVVIGANASERDRFGLPTQARGPAEAYAREHRYTYTFTYGNDAFKNACRVRGLPTMLVVDRRGLVRAVQVGFDDNLDRLLESAILPLLDEAG